MKPESYRMILLTKLFKFEESVVSTRSLSRSGMPFNSSCCEPNLAAHQVTISLDMSVQTSMAFGSLFLPRSIESNAVGKRSDSSVNPCARRVVFVQTWMVELREAIYVAFTFHNRVTQWATFSHKAKGRYVDLINGLSDAVQSRVTREVDEGAILPTFESPAPCWPKLMRDN